MNNAPTKTVSIGSYARLMAAISANHTILELGRVQKAGELVLSNHECGVKQLRALVDIASLEIVSVEPGRHLKQITLGSRLRG